MGLPTGSLAHIKSVSESEHHLATSLASLMVALLPQVGGYNPRLASIPVGDFEFARAVNATIPVIESTSILIYFLFLSTPLQVEIAQRLKQPVDVLARAVASWTRR